jgi:hypothetical protein
MPSGRVYDDQAKMSTRPVPCCAENALDGSDPAEFATSIALSAIHWDGPRFSPPLLACCWNDSAIEIIMDEELKELVY